MSMENLRDKTEYELSRILLTAKGLSTGQRQEDFRKLCRSLLNLKKLTETLVNNNHSQDLAVVDENWDSWDPVYENIRNKHLPSLSSPPKVSKSASSPRSGLQCGYCLKVLENKRELARHVVSLHTNQAFQCMTCKNVFPVMTDVVKHMECEHRVNSSMAETFIDSPPDLRGMTCLICNWDVLGGGEKELRLHSKSKHPGEELRLRDFQFFCRRCGREKTFVNEVSVNKHIREHKVKRECSERALTNISIPLSGRVLGGAVGHVGEKREEEMYIHRDRSTERWEGEHLDEVNKTTEDDVFLPCSLVKDGQELSSPGKDGVPALSRPATPPPIQPPLSTIKQLSSPSNYHTLLLYDLWDLESADCSLVAEHGEVTVVHSVLLESIWPWFKDLKNTLCNSCDMMSINLPVSQLTIQQLVCLIYTGECFIQNLQQFDLVKKLVSYLQLNLELSLGGCDESSWVALMEEGFTKAKGPSCVSSAREFSGMFTGNMEDEVSELKPGYSLPSLFYESCSKSKELGGPILKGNDTVCSLNCNNRCREKVSNWTMVEKREMEDSFQGLNAVKKQQKLLKQLEFQENAGISTEGFCYKKQLLCVKQMSSLSLISTYVLQKVIKSYHKGFKVYYHGNESKSKCLVASIGFCSWMKVFSERFGQDGPVDVVTVLPSYLNVTELYKLYRKEAVAPHVKQATFYKLFKSKFGPRRQDKTLPWIRISKVSTHSRCDVCVGLDQYIRKTKNEAELEYGRSLKHEHTEKYSRARIAVNEFIQKSINFPQEVVAMQIDSMDNSKSLIPRVLEKSKQLSGMFRLPCKITGAITTSGRYQQNQRIKFFIQHGTSFLLFNIVCPN